MTEEQQAITTEQSTETDAKVEETPAKGGETAQVATTSSTEADEVARLQKENEQLRRLQGQADRKARREALARQRAEQRFKGGDSTPVESGEELPQPAINQDVEKLKAESGITRSVYSSEKYRKVLDADPTLRRIIESNPLALVKNPIDAEDAILQIQELLDTRSDELSESPKSQPKVEAKETTTKETPPGFNAGVVNPKGIPQKQYEGTLKNRNFEDAVDQKINDPTAWKTYGE